MPTKTEEDVIGFLAQELDIDKSRISIWTRLRQDLNVDGDAANELIVNFAYAFHVNIDNFRVNDYFATEEGYHQWMAAILAVFGNARRLKTLAVRDLVVAADKGVMI